jgi:signal transduction histidine kinase
VATLVAEGTTPGELFAAVVNEAARALNLATVVLGRYEPHATVRILASLDEATFTAGSSWRLDGPSIAASVLDTGRPSRIDDYSELPGAIAAAVRESRLRSTVGVPIVVNRAVWGVMTVGTRESEPLPADTEARLGHFTELLAFAISNAETREQLSRLAEQQGALRRVATLVAARSTTAELWTAVVEEVAAVVGVPAAWLLRYGPGRSMTVLAVLNDPALAVGTRWPLDGTSVTGAVFDTALSARIDDYSNLDGALAERTRESGFLSSLGVPIIVDGTVWGAICVGTREVDPLPADTESRLADFTDLVATAISNAEARSELIASRARLVAAGDEARKRIERSLHHGTQQRLLAIGLDVQRIKASVPAEESDVRSGLERIGRDLELVLEGVRELSRGLHPPMLARRGLRTTLVALAGRSPIPVDLDIELDERPPEQIERVVYYAVSEALTNAIKHSNASAISVKIATDHPGGRFATGPDTSRGGLNLHVTVADDGDGGAAPARGLGLAEIVDRVDALGGRLSIDSPPGRGTRIAIALPLTAHAEP